MWHLHCHFDCTHSRGVEDFEEVEDLKEDSCAVVREDVDVLAEAVVMLGCRGCERGSRATRT